MQKVGFDSKLLSFSSDSAGRVKLASTLSTALMPAETLSLLLIALRGCLLPAAAFRLVPLLHWGVGLHTQEGWQDWLTACTPLTVGLCQHNTISGECHPRWRRCQYALVPNS